jgi:hypothetical protein
MELDFEKGIKTELEDDGFKGFKSIEKLRTDVSIIPKEKGIYLILNNKPAEGKFLEESILIHG